MKETECCLLLFGYRGTCASKENCVDATIGINKRLVSLVSLVFCFYILNTW